MRMASDFIQHRQHQGDGPHLARSDRSGDIDFLAQTIIDSGTGRMGNTAFYLAGWLVSGPCEVSTGACVSCKRGSCGDFGSQGNQPVSANAHPRRHRTNDACFLTFCQTALLKNDAVGEVMEAHKWIADWRQPVREVYPHGLTVRLRRAIRAYDADSAAESTTRAPRETYEAALVVSGISTEDERQAVQSAFIDAMAPVKCPTHTSR